MLRTQNPPPDFNNLNEQRFGLRKLALEARRRRKAGKRAEGCAIIRA